MGQECSCHLYETQTKLMLTTKKKNFQVVATFWQDFSSPPFRWSPAMYRAIYILISMYLSSWATRFCVEGKWQGFNDFGHPRKLQGILRLLWCSLGTDRPVICYGWVVDWYVQFITVVVFKLNASLHTRCGEESGVVACRKPFSKIMLIEGEVLEE